MPPYTTKMAIIKKMIASVGKDMENLEPSHIAGGHINWCSLCGKVWLFLKTLNLELPYDVAVSLLSVYSREMKAFAHTKTCT